MATQNSAQQLAFDWDLPEEVSDAALSAEDIQARKDIAQAMLENPASWPKGERNKPVKPYWFDHYLRLLDGVRFPFRAAVLAAWLATPKRHRWPKTQDELANLLGMSSDRQFGVWRERNPQIDQTVQNAWKERVIDGLADSVDAMLEVAATPNYKSVRAQELHFRMADVLKNVFTINSVNVDFDKMSFDDKLRLAGLDTPEKMTAFLKDAELAQRIDTEDQDESENSDETQP